MIPPEAVNVSEESGGAAGDVWGRLSLPAAGQDIVDGRTHPDIQLSS